MAKECRFVKTFREDISRHLRCRDPFWDRDVMEELNSGIALERRVTNEHSDECEPLLRDF